MKLILIFFLLFPMIQDNCYPEKISIPLPKPTFTDSLSLDETLNKRKSIRQYSETPLAIDKLSHMLWATYGKTQSGKLTAPSAGALYPITIYIVAQDITGIESGLYKYENEKHAIAYVSDQIPIKKISAACFNQSFLEKAPLLIIISARFEITTARYGKRGVNYVLIETGHVGQNIYLEAVNLGLATVAIGAFDEKKMQSLLAIEETPLYIMPVGIPYGKKETRHD